LAGLTQRVTASFGGRARFWRARRYAYLRRFYAMRWLFHTRHLASETRAYPSAARYLVRRSALSIVLAVLLVLALHVVERSWISVVSDVGLGGTALGRAITRPVDRGTYAILLQSVAAVTGVFLALYFTAVSTVAATVYSEVPHDIRDLMLRDKFGNFYVRAVAFLSALAVFLLVEESSGGAAYHLALPIVALLAGFAAFAFITLGQRAFYFSDPTVLSELVVGDFLRWFSEATARGWQWTDPSFQEHYRKRARRAAGSLNALLQSSRTHDFVRDDSERSVVSCFVKLLRVYLTQKTTVPTHSRWFGETYEHRQWYLTDSTVLGLASETASPLTPSTVPDVNWVEKALLGPVLKAIGENLRTNRGEAACLACSSSNPEQLVPLVASVDMLAGLPVSIEVGLYRRLSELNVTAFAAKLESTDWTNARPLAVQPRVAEAGHRDAGGVALRAGLRVAGRERGAHARLVRRRDHPKSARLVRPRGLRSLPRRDRDVVPRDGRPAVGR
jgi:hypothetical protein